LHYRNSAYHLKKWRLMSKRSSRPKKKSPEDRAPERRNSNIMTFVAFFTLLVTAAAFIHTRWRDSEQTKIEAGKHVIETVSGLLDEDSSVVAPVAEGLARLGDTATAQTLLATVAAKQRGRQRMNAVLLPEEPDSAEAVVASVENDVRRQSVPSGFVASSAQADAQAALQVEIVPIPRDSARTTLPSGEIVERGELGGLWQDGYGRTMCGGVCLEGQVCCRLAPTP
jgi:hypothetical protein